jgi:hypothetical protein
MGAMASAVLQDETARITGKPDWWPDWRDETIACIASGPTAKKAGVELLRGRAKVIAINESWQLCPWADMLYGCDWRWWFLHHGVQAFKGLKLAAEQEACNQFKEIKKVTIVDVDCNELQFDRAGHIGAGGNSGFQCLNLAAQFGGSRILLVGYDMRIDLGEHWHPRHYPPLSNPHPNDNLPRWRKAIDGAHKSFAQVGIEVINCSPVSLLTAYPKMTIAEALEWSPCHQSIRT